MKTLTLTLSLALAGCAACSARPATCATVGVIAAGMTAYAVGRHHGIGYESPRPRSTIGTPACAGGTCQ
jgi:hypothetical protein